MFDRCLPRRGSCGLRGGGGGGGEGGEWRRWLGRRGRAATRESGRRSLTGETIRMILRLSHTIVEYAGDTSPV